MATQGKGILGAPHGKIGSIHFYNRLGKSIVQSNSIPTDSYLRRWNLLKWQLTERLTYYWNFVTVGQRSVWLANAPSGLTDFEYYLLYNLDFVYNSQFDSLAGASYYYNNQSLLVEFGTIGNWGQRYFTLNINPLNEIWTNHAIIRFRVTAHSPTLAPLTFNKDFSTSIIKPLTYNFSASITDAYAFLVIRIDGRNPNLNRGTYILDIRNPLFIQQIPI